MSYDTFVSYGTRSGPQWGSQSDAERRYAAHKSLHPIAYAGVSGDSLRLVGLFQGAGKKDAETHRVKLTQTGIDGISSLEKFLLGRVGDSELVNEILSRAGLRRAETESICTSTQGL